MSAVARKQKPAAPVSAAVQRLVAQISAEARAEQLAELSAKDGIVVLQPMHSATTTWDLEEGNFFNTSDRRGAVICMWRTEKDRSKWTGSQTLIDGQGREWRSTLCPHVVDNFGNLVPLAQGGAA